MEQQTLLLGDSHAKTFHPRECKGESPKEKEAPSTGKCLESLAYCDQNTSSLKTYQDCLLEKAGIGLQPFSMTWPKSGMMQNGIVYSLAGLENLIDEKEFTLLPTPMTSDGKEPNLLSRLRATESWETAKMLTARLKGLFLGLKGREENKETYVVNPCVMENMMGYPIGWTEVQDLETP